MASIFEQTIVPKLNFSNFPLHEWQEVTQNFGQLVPVYIREVLPNDVFTLSAFMNIEFAPMVAPMYHEVNASLHFFFVPDRIVWEDFPTFITGCEDGNPIPEEDIPVQAGIPKNKFKDIRWLSDAQGTILDYFGLPNNINAQTLDTEIVSDIPMRDYFLIWYEYYRDENLQVTFNYSNPVTQQEEDFKYYDFWRNWRRNSTAEKDGSFQILADAMRNFNPFYRAYRKDYFTGALPTPQKGEPVTLSLGTEVPVSVKSSDTFTLFDQTTALGIRVLPATGYHFSGDNVLSVSESIEGADRSGRLQAEMTDGDNYITGDVHGLQGRLRKNIGSQYSTQIATADLSQATAITVERLREAFAVQEILESLSMRGSRFNEFLKGNFGVVPDDYRLQKPQFIGGIVTPVQVMKVVQTSGYSGEDSRDMTGYAAGRAFAAAKDRIFRMRFKEHGYIIGISSIMPKNYVFQGIPRHFLRHDRFDYYLPQTAHLGEQGIENQELYYDPTNYTYNKKVFGFIPRWAEYKSSMNGIHGDFRGNLNYYHMARIFDSRPTLSEEFISTQGLQTRPFAVWSSEHSNINHLIWSEYYFRVVGSRPMPYHSIPKVI